MKGKRGAQEDVSHSVASEAVYWEGICFRGERCQAEHGVPVRHPSGGIRKAGSYMSLELSAGLGGRYKDERHSCVITFKVIYKRTN